MTALPEIATYFDEQVRRGRRQIAEHVCDVNECCRRCGRDWPCPIVVDAHRTVSHYLSAQAEAVAEFGSDGGIDDGSHG